MSCFNVFSRLLRIAYEVSCRAGDEEGSLLSLRPLFRAKARIGGSPALNLNFGIMKFSTLCNIHPVRLLRQPDI